MDLIVPTSLCLLLHLLQKPRASLDCTRPCPSQRTLPPQFATDKYQLVSSYQEVLRGAADSFNIFRVWRRGALEAALASPTSYCLKAQRQPSGLLCLSPEDRRAGYPNIHGN